MAELQVRLITGLISQGVMRVIKVFALIIATACTAAAVAEEKPHLHGSINSPAAPGASVKKPASASTKQSTPKTKKRGLDLVIVDPSGSYISNLNPNSDSSNTARARRESMATYANRRARDLMQKKDYENALREFNEAIMANPDMSYVIGRAELYELMGRYEDAARDWNEIYTDCPQADGDLLLGAEFFKKRADYESALKFCNQSLKAYPSSQAYRTRADIYKASGNYRQAIEDAYSAYRTALQSGYDGQAERQLLKAWLGKDPGMPQPPRQKVGAVLSVIKALSESKKPFSPTLTSRLTGLALTELPLQGTSEHTGSFESLVRDSSKEWWRVELDRPDAGGYRNCLELVLNPAVVSVSEDDVRSVFGACDLIPNRSTMCILSPAHMEYIRPWGKLTFLFQDSGFKSLSSVVMWVEPISKPTSRSGSRSKD